MLPTSQPGRSWPTKGTGSPPASGSTWPMTSVPSRTGTLRDSTTVPVIRCALFDREDVDATTTPFGFCSGPPDGSTPSWRSVARFRKSLRKVGPELPGNRSPGQPFLPLMVDGGRGRSEAGSERRSRLHRNNLQRRREVARRPYPQRRRGVRRGFVSAELRTVRRRSSDGSGPLPRHGRHPDRRRSRRRRHRFEGAPGCPGQ